MKKSKERNCFIVFFVISAALTISVEAQEFRGFYGSNSELKNHVPSFRNRRSAGVVNKNAGYIYSTGEAVDYESSPYYAKGNFNQPYEKNPSTYFVNNLTINIFSPDYIRTADYYNKSSKYDEYNKSYYPPNNRIPAGIQTIKINGERFYKMNGNYYRVDRFENLNDINNQTNHQLGQYYNAKGRKTTSGVYSVKSDEDGNSDNFGDGYNNRNNAYAGKRWVDSTISVLMKEKRALKEENDALKQKLTEQKVNRFERKKRNQNLREDNEIEEPQVKQEDYTKLEKSEKENESEANIFYSSLNIGDTVNQVPQHSKVITIDGKKTYISPANIYYQKQKNGKFVVVGMEEK